MPKNKAIVLSPDMARALQTALREKGKTVILTEIEYEFLIILNAQLDDE